MVNRLVSVDDSSKQFPTDVREIIADNLANPGTVEGAAIAAAVSNGGTSISDRLRPVTATSSIATWGSSTIEGYLTTTSLSAELATALGVTTLNGGVGSQESSHIVARMGGMPIVFPALTVPASGGVTFTTSTMPATSGMSFSAVGVLDTPSGPIPGTVSKLLADTQYTFTRTSAGSSTSVPAGSEFLADAHGTYGDWTVVLNVGKNNAYTDPQSVIDDTRAAVMSLRPLALRVLVLGHFPNDISSFDVGGTGRTFIETIDAAYAAEYGDYFISLDDFICSPLLWDYAGLVPTGTDLTKQAAGRLPPSIQANTSHLNTAGQVALAELVRRRMETLAWYAAADPNPVYTSDSFGVRTGAVVGSVSDFASGGAAKTWAGAGGSITISSGSLLAAASSGSAYFPVTFADQYVSAKITTLPASNTDVLRVRSASTAVTGANCYRLQITGAGALSLGKRVGGVDTNIGTQAAVATSIAAGDRAGLLCVGNNISVVKNGVVVFTIADADIPTSAYAGVFMSTSVTTRVDDVLVQEITQPTGLVLAG